MSRGRGGRIPPPGVELVTGDIRDRARAFEIVQEGGYDGVVHLASLTSGRDSFADPLGYFDVNATGILNLLMALDAARTTTAPASQVFASTNIVYGSQHHGALSEDLDLHPESPYAASKVTAEHMVAVYAATGAIGRGPSSGPSTSPRPSRALPTPTAHGSFPTSSAREAEIQGPPQTAAPRMVEVHGPAASVSTVTSNAPSGELPTAFVEVRRGG
ncbi:GDP-mannose 4,6-dehydratase [Micromonospora sp. NPDC048947]|uniref:GDP-mannose 4,6-dehydratase n=1 Tax=Micromonospora sp. NPDC048947 TaxID=3154826 RepID=UPI0033E0B0CB